jgi:glucosamine--fructose-6-phosphate aminotransferase (isomerizing)
VAIVHNGIIENYVSLRAELQAGGHVFTSETDTEVMALLIDERIGSGHEPARGRAATVRELEGAYAIAVISRDEPGRVVGARRGAPLLVGIGIGENFLGSDAQALIQVTNKMMYLDEDDVVEITRDSVQVYGLDGRRSSARCTRANCRPMRWSAANTVTTCRRKSSSSRAPWPTRWKRASVRTACCRTSSASIAMRCCSARVPAHHRLRHQLSRRSGGQVLDRGIRAAAGQRRSSQRIPLPRCGGAGRHAVRRHLAVRRNGRHAGRLRESRRRGYLGTLAICNVPESSLVREADLKLMTRAGPEIGVASTKAFTTQLAAWRCWRWSWRVAMDWTRERYASLCAELQHLPRAIENALKLEPAIIEAGGRIHPSPARAVPRPRRAVSGRAGRLAQAQGNFLYPCRGVPGRRAQAWPAGAGRRKHAGSGRGAEWPAAGQAQVQPAGSARPRRPLIVFADGAAGMDDMASVRRHAACGSGGSFIAPAVFTVPLQLLLITWQCLSRRTVVLRGSCRSRRAESRRHGTEPAAP